MSQRRRVAVLGSTGSVGTQTLDVIREFRDEFAVVGLSSHSSPDQLGRQVEEFAPEVVGLTDESLRADGPGEWIYGSRALEEIASLDLDLIVISVVGTAGLKPCMSALRNDTDVALANKEVLVAGGGLVTDAQEKSDAEILPVDSEHSALFQVLNGERTEEVSRLIITASGGPFLDHSPEQLENISPAEALDHPNWDMGYKITVDSATMMNKGLEVIEACRLFNLEPDRVQAFIHPQSVVHGLVEFVDHSTLAQCSAPDMRLPIQYALFYPKRRQSVIEPIDFSRPFTWEFEPIDCDKFPAYGLAREALVEGGSAPAVLNAANEVAVEAFVDKKIGYSQIPRVVETCLSNLDFADLSELEQLLAVDREARLEAGRTVEELSK